jgi:hypothetical protein
VATRSIVTSQPDVPCDVCGRRLLRGEQPDVFLAGGRRRTVCELCAPRASHEGWLRETDGHSLSLPPARPRRGRSLLDRLRQREPVTPPSAIPAIPTTPDRPVQAASYDFFDGGPGVVEQPAPGAEEIQAPDFAQISATVPGYASPSNPQSAPPDLERTAAPVSVVAFPDPDPDSFSATSAPSDDLALAQRALEVFNAGEHPRRVAGVARSLGAPSVTVRTPVESGATIAIVVAWELCWYRYEVDLADETAGARVADQGTELSELTAEDQIGNVLAGEDGALSLVESVLR